MQASGLGLEKPFLKWAGGKRQLLTDIRANAPKRYDAYFEPFVGGGAVLFSLLPQNAVINDSNRQLVTAYRVVRDNVEELIELLAYHRASNTPEHYYAVRQWDRDEQAFSKRSDTEKAARLIFLNKTCFNGLYRVNSKGQFNVPYGKYENPAICEDEVLRSVSRYLSQNQITILHGDFEQAVDQAGPGAFVYFDPPYHSPGNTSFTNYQADGFGEAQQERLRDAFVRLAAKGAKCLLSNSDTPYIRKLYRGYGFKIKTVQASRAINSSPIGRGKVNEILVRSW